MRIPPNLRLTAAATLPSGVATAALALYRHLALPLLPETVAGSPWILVYGGSSASGSIAIQFAKLYVDLTNSSASKTDAHPCKVLD